MKSLYEIIHFYGVTPHSIEQITPFVYQIEGRETNYALKRSHLSKETVLHWEHVYDIANLYEFIQVLPVYRTKDQSLFFQSNETIYYLSPWVNEQGDKSAEKIYQGIGTIHHQTKHEQTIEQESLLPKFKNYQAYHEQTEEKLIAIVEEYEAQHYMSPIQLQVCTHFRDVELATKLLKDRINLFIDSEPNEEDWSFSLCHGQLTFDHFLSTSGNDYLINWEKSSFHYPIFDLIYFFKQEGQQYHAQKEAMIKNFPVYMDKNELTKNELNLMLIYLLDPTQYIVQVEQYNHGNEHQMIELTKSLQRQYRVLCFAIELSHYIEAEYERIVLNSDEDQSHSK